MRDVEGDNAAPWAACLDNNSTGSLQAFQHLDIKGSETTSA